MPDRKEWLKFDDWITRKVRTTAGGAVLVRREMPDTGENGELDYQIFLEQVSHSMIRFKKPEHLIRMIIRTIDEYVKTTHAAMLMYSRKKNCFLLVDSKGRQGHKIPRGFIKLTMENPLIRFFSEKSNYLISDSGVINYRDLIDALQGKKVIEGSSGLKELLPRVIKHMELLKASTGIPVYYKRELLGMFILGEKLSRTDFSRQEIGFFTTLANDVAMALSNAQLIQDLYEKVLEVHTLYEREHKMFIHTAISLAATIDARDPYTHGHTERVTKYALAIAEELEDLPEAREYPNFKETLHISALLHDVGKIGVPDSILNKSGPLTNKEYAKVKEHPATGAAILYPIGELGDIAVEVRSHHERYDGKGYPEGLKKEEIPFIARIIAVADTYDAVTSDRPYRQKKLAEVAVQVIKVNSGKQFDPIVVSAFLLAYKKGKVG
ncbi:MAG: HD domain-containing protein, partial [Candidatus Omnitrophica bacterium]|nr:HD domain-containing protein [Candidatus Omnitrophota bacterium]